MRHVAAVAAGLLLAAALQRVTRLVGDALVGVGHLRTTGAR